jgi:hypothetical protein
MTTRTVAISMEEEEIERAKAAAAEMGLSFSAFVARATRHELQTINGRKYREWRASLTGEDASWRDEWDRMGVEEFNREFPSEADSAGQAA